MNATSTYSYTIPRMLHHTWGALRAAYRSYADFTLLGPVILKYEPSPAGTAHATETSITIDPAFDKSLGNDVDMKVGVLLHEIFHVILQDVATMKRWHGAGMVHCPAIPNLSIPARILPYDHKVANISMDCRINDACTRILGAKLPQGACYHPEITFNATSEEAYTITWQAENPDSGKSTPRYQPGDGTAPGKGACDVSEQGDTGQPSPYHTDPGRMKSMARQAIEESDTSKSRGLGPGELNRLADMVEPRKIDWYDIIPRTVIAACGREQNNWSSPNTTMMAMGRVWPSKRGERAGTIVFECDSSGSMNKQMLGLVIGSIDYAIQECLPERVIMLDVDDKVQRVREFENPEDLISALRDLPCRDDQTTSLRGGGGTNMGHAFTWCKENDVFPDVMVILTDAGTGWPSSIDPAAECIVAVTDPRPEVLASVPAHMGTKFCVTPL